MSPRRAGINPSVAHRRVSTLLLLFRAILANVAPLCLILFRRCSPFHVGMLQKAFKCDHHTHFRDEEIQAKERPTGRVAHRWPSRAQVLACQGPCFCHPPCRGPLDAPFLCGLILCNVEQLGISGLSDRHFLKYIRPFFWLLLPKSIWKLAKYLKNNFALFFKYSNRFCNLNISFGP